MVTRFKKFSFFFKMSVCQSSVHPSISTPFNCLYICLFVCLSVCLFVYLNVCSFVYLFEYLAIYIFPFLLTFRWFVSSLVCLSVCLSVYMFVHLPICLICPAVCRFISLAIRPSVCSSFVSSLCYLRTNV
jgi:hypothetical protein